MRHYQPSTAASLVWAHVVAVACPSASAALHSGYLAAATLVVLSALVCQLHIYKDPCQKESKG